jgi:phage terminase small subunit
VKNKPAEDRRRRFAEEYCVDFNATQAAIRAGYAPRGAHVTGCRLLTEPKIAETIRKLMEAATKRAGITVERTQQEIARIAYGDIRRLFDGDNRLRDVTTLDEDTAAMLGGLETEELWGETENAEGRTRREVIGLTRKVKMRDKLKALDQCMSLLGMHKTATPGTGEENVLHLSIRLSGK